MTAGMRALCGRVDDFVAVAAGALPWSASRARHRARPQQPPVTSPVGKLRRVVVPSVSMPRVAAGAGTCESEPGGGSRQGLDSVLTIGRRRQGCFGCHGRCWSLGSSGRGNYGSSEYNSGLEIRLRYHMFRNSPLPWSSPVLFDSRQWSHLT